jgi:hypothetical protein
VRKIRLIEGTSLGQFQKWLLVSGEESQNKHEMLFFMIRGKFVLRIFKVGRVSVEHLIFHFRSLEWRGEVVSFLPL